MNETERHLRLVPPPVPSWACSRCGGVLVFPVEDFIAEWEAELLHGECTRTSSACSPRP